MASQKKGHGSNVEQTPAKPDDMLVMATNNSSIVSKRSVERLYYPDEAPLFRFFVPNKPQRRAPLINRGYYLRLHAIDVTLRNFLSQPSPSATKVILNLGCGFDVVPWQCWARYGNDCQSVQFVDVDFLELLQKKRHIVLNTPALNEPLGHVNTENTNPHVLLRSDRYTQIGVDLRHIAALEAAVKSVLDVQNCHFLFIAEVSITYMDTSAADALIQWAAGLGQAAEFCLLEQILPDGPAHPFAQTMLQHFEKLSCPIKSVGTYSTIPEQRQRFRNKGWPSVEAQSLWSAWSRDSFLSSTDRQQLDQIEPFDEHEEFALFASHYLLLHARSYGPMSTSPNEPVSQIPSIEIHTTYARLTGQHGLRRFGSAMAVADEFGKTSIINCLGLGHNNRLSSYDVYARKGAGNSDMHITPPGGPSSRMCGTLTDLGHIAVLVGGRASPAKPMNDCWIFRKQARKWERTHDMPVPLYRHSACRLAGSSLLMVLGGRPKDPGVLVYHPSDGWLECSIKGLVMPKLVFGAVLTCSGSKPGTHPVFEGYVAGGLSESSIIDKRVLAWTLSFDDRNKPTITFSEADIRGGDTVRLLSRFGAACIQYHGSFVLLGGVGFDGLISREDDIVLFSTSGSRIEAISRLVPPLTGIPRPLIVGSSVVDDDGDLVLIGGAATCFSMGTFWTRGVYTLKLPGNLHNNNRLGQDDRFEYSHSGEIVQAPPEDLRPAQASPQPTAVRPVNRVRLSAGLSFEDIVAEGEPVVIQGLEIGSCTAQWSLGYLASQIGPDRKVVIHDSHVKSMDFNGKTFVYKTMSFGDFAAQVQDGKRLYLRSLSADAPADQPASLEQDFPALGAEFVLPDELRICRENMHSSILRISGPVNMWLHFDVQANVYCQIQGSKRMLLFPPSDVTHLSFAPGASSSSIDVFGSLNSSALAGTHPFEAELRPGEVLYLPPLWLHTATPTSDVSVAVNVFFRSLESGHYATGRDVYGNKDLAAYEKGRQDISRIAQSFAKIPASCKQFYLLRLADELAEKARDLED